MRYLLFFIFFGFITDLAGQGIEPFMLQGSPYKRGFIRSSNTKIWDEVLQDSIYLYFHADSTVAATASGTVTSVGLTTGTTGTDINVSGSPVTTSGSFTLNIPTASASNRGALSSTDWTTFNNKLGSLNGLTSAAQTFSSTTSGQGFTITSSGSNHAFNLPYTENSTSLRLGQNATLMTNGIAIGNEAGDSDCSNCFALGKDVLTNTTTGASNNVGIGLQAFTSATNAINGVAIGNYSQYLNQTGDNNIAIGESSMLSNITGDDNVAIGRFTLRDNNVSGCVAIGNAAGRFNSTSNTLWIENSDGTTPLIGGNFTTNQVGINTPIGSLARTLTVTGEMRVTDLTTDTPTQIVGRDAEGDFGTFTATTGQVLKYNGTVWEAAADNAGFSGTGTTNKIPYFTSSTALAATNIHFNSNGLGFGNTNPLWALHLTNKAIYMQGASTIIDANNSGGPSGEFLMSTGGSGLDWQQIQLFRSTTGGGKDVTVTGGSTIANALVPTNGTAGQVLRKGTSGYDWATPNSEVFGQLYNTGNLTAQTLDGTAREIDFTTPINSNMLQVNTTTNLIEVPATGTYEISYSGSYQISSPNVNNVRFYTYKNGSDLGYMGQTRTRNSENDGGNIVSFSRTYITELNSGDDIELFYDNSLSGTSSTISFFNLVLSVKRLK